MFALQIRNSYGMFIPRAYDAITNTVEERLSNWTGLPRVNQEDMQVLTALNFLSPCCSHY